MELRRVTYKLYPSRVQAARLDAVHELHRRLYNAALEERIAAWRTSGVSISYVDQCRSLTGVRADHPEYRALNAQSAQVTLKRLDEAFGHFFRRVREGGTPGFPRFKSRDRFPGWGYKSHGDGFRFAPGTGWRNGHLRLSGIGWMQARGRARTPGEVRTCEIMRKADGWFASVTVACEPHREIDADARQICGIDWGIDWGIENYLTVAHDLDHCETLPNERFWQAESEALKERQRELSRALRGKRSKRARKRKGLLAKRHRKLANRRKNRSHQASARIVRSHRMIATEAITPASMTRSARGSVENPGKNVAQKAGLNREVLDTAPGGFLSLLAYKAEEAGCELVILPTRSLKPSRRCPIAWTVRRKPLAQRTHALPDGTTIHRDHASGLVMIRAALNQIGREPAWVPAAHSAQEPETPSRAA